MTILIVYELRDGKDGKRISSKLRAIRGKMNEDIKDMSFEEVKTHLKNMREQNSVKK